MFREFDMSYTRPMKPSTTTSTRSGDTSSHDVKCDGHDEPAIRLTVMNGGNRGRIFYKCNRPDPERCRFFKWEDGQGNHPRGAPTAVPSSAAPRASTSGTSVPTTAPRTAFGGGGQTLGPPLRSPNSVSSVSSGGSNGASQSVGQTSTRTPMRSNRLGMHTSSSSTESSTSASESPTKKRRTEWGQAPSLSSGTPNTSRAGLPLSQTAEEAIEEDWPDDLIEEVEDAEANRARNASPKGKFAERFTSFGPTTPKSKQESSFLNSHSPMKTPPRIPQHLPVTPTSLLPGALHTPRNNVDANASKWQQIRDDPSSPFHARANALLGSNGQAGQAGSPISSNGTGELLSSPSPLKSSNDALAGSGTAPDTPSDQIRTITSSFSELSASIASSLEAASKTTATLELKLKAAQKKTLYHEKREKEAREELEEARRKIAALQRENEELRSGML